MRERKLLRQPICAKFPDKKIHFSLSEAWIGAWKVWQKHRKEMSPYRCYACHWFHLTSQIGDIPTWLEDYINKQNQ